MKMELNCLIFIKYQIGKYYSINFKMINATWDVFHMICAKRWTTQSNYNVQLPYSRGLQTKKDQTRLSISCSWNGSEKRETLTCAPKFVQFARGGTNGMLFTNAKTNTPINYKTILLLQTPKAPTRSYKMTFVATPPRSPSVTSVLNFWSPASSCNLEENRDRLFLFPSSFLYLLLPDFANIWHSKSNKGKDDEVTIHANHKERILSFYEIGLQRMDAIN